jgi:geranylgeranyl diphosphate synthase type II
METPVKSLLALQSYFLEELSRQEFQADPSELYDPIVYTLELGGKRLRPVLSLMACDMFGGDYTKALHTAIGIELFHNFTLLHDDIMDDAPLRRGKETVYRKWDTNIAILSGDAMFVKAYQYICRTPQQVLPGVLDVFNKTALEVCEGQQYDMNFESRTDVTIPEYIRMIAYKTAVLLGAALKVGAMIAEVSKEDAESIYNFGLNLGIAFQIQDDILDVFGQQEKVGKQTGGDILTNKKTYLFLKALETAQGDMKSQLEHYFSSKDFDPQEKLKAVINIYDQLEIKKHSEAEKERYYSKSLEALNRIDIPAERKEPLLEFARALMVRES